MQGVARGEKIGYNETEVNNTMIEVRSAGYPEEIPCGKGFLGEGVRRRKSGVSRPFLGSRGQSVGDCRP